MERSIKHLCQLDDDRLFAECAIGIEKVVEVVQRLDAAAASLSASGQNLPASILGDLAAEEAAKVLILIDLIRCPKARGLERSRVARYFYDHVAKGVYAIASRWNVADFNELAEGINEKRAAYYLDGPNDVDWIFRNSILQEREDQMYVGYVRDDTEGEGLGEPIWTSPDADSSFPYSQPFIVRIAISLFSVGLTSPASLKIIASIWRHVNPSPAMPVEELWGLNHKTLEELHAAGHLKKEAEAEYGFVWKKWPYPMWPLDLTEDKKNAEDLKKALRRKRQEWQPGFE